MLDVFKGLSEQEIYDRTRPFFFLECGDMFTHNCVVYLKVGRIPVSGMDCFPIEYNAVSLYSGVPVTFSNDTIVIEVDNPYK